MSGAWFSPPFNAGALRSSRNSLFCFSGPWHFTQCTSKIGLMSFEKSTERLAAGGKFGVSAPIAFQVAIKATMPLAKTRRHICGRGRLDMPSSEDWEICLAEITITRCIVQPIESPRPAFGHSTTAYINDERSARKLPSPLSGGRETRCTLALPGCRERQHQRRDYDAWHFEIRLIH